MSSERYYWVYILASMIGGTFYVGVTNNLVRRVYEHRNDLVAGFSKDYKVHKLVYFEPHTDIEAAIRREKRLKRWNRAWKVRLIEEQNPNWDDLYSENLRALTILCTANAGRRVDRQAGGTKFRFAITGSSAFANDDN